MLTIYRRHLGSCPHRSRSYRRCSCPIWVQGTLGRETIRRALDVTSVETASNLVRQWTTVGTIGAVKDEDWLKRSAYAKRTKKPDFDQVLAPGERSPCIQKPGGFGAIWDVEKSATL